MQIIRQPGEVQYERCKSHGGWWAFGCDAVDALCKTLSSDKRSYEHLQDFQSFPKKESQKTSLKSKKTKRKML